MGFFISVVVEVLICFRRRDRRDAFRFGFGSWVEVGVLLVKVCSVFFIRGYVRREFFGRFSISYFKYILVLFRFFFGFGVLVFDYLF